MYKILSTEVEDGKRLIKVLDKIRNTTLSYYVEEINYIPDNELRKYLKRRIHFIENGGYG